MGPVDRPQKKLPALLRYALFPPLLLLMALLAPIPARWYYQGPRPTRLGRGVTRVWSAAVAAGITPDSWPGRPKIGASVLEVTGRKSGRVYSRPVTWIEYEGERYLVSMTGEAADWVRNVRAAAGSAVLKHGSRDQVRLEELRLDQRTPVIRAWYSRAGRSGTPRYHFGLTRSAGDEEFERVAASHPVFRIVRERADEVRPREG